MNTSWKCPQCGYINRELRVLCMKCDYQTGFVRWAFREIWPAAVILFSIGLFILVLVSLSNR